MARIERTSTPTIPSPQETPRQRLSFPSQEIIERIRNLGQVDVTPTNLIGMSSEQIARLAVEGYNGVLRVNVSKASPEEIVNIRNAARVEIPTQYDPRQPNIIITGDTSREGWFDSEENQILRAINEEILGDGVNAIGQRAFRRFIEVLFTDPNKRNLVQDEWNKFIVEHPHSRNVVSPYETHHFRNVGLRTRSEGEDSLRDRVVAFVTETMDGVRNDVEAIFAGEGLKKHSSLALNTSDGRILALGMAFYSNFVRGACFYRYIKGDGYLKEYEPRKLAAEIIDQVTAEYNSPPEVSL